MSSYKTKVEFDEDKIMRALSVGMVRAVNMIGIQLNNNIAERLNNTGTGKKHRGLSYTSSKKGQPPAVQTGLLMKSWQAKPKARFAQQRGKVFAIIQQGANAESSLVYGAILESKKGLDRPFLRGKKGAVNRTRPFAEKTLRTEINKAIKKANRIT